MTFTEWLIVEKRVDMRVNFFNDGTVIFYIDGKRYVYMTDPVFHDQWQKLARYKPGKVLNQIKNLVTLGKATLEQKPVH
jgi:hypothetical protein